MHMVRQVNVITREDLGFRSALTNTHTHSLHPYPAKFIPQIATELVTKYSQPGELVADIFAGSGTTNLEAMLSGRHSYALDVNPLATLLTQAKTAIVQPDVLSKEIERVLASVNKTAPDLVLQSDVVQAILIGKNQERLTYWFPEENVVKLALLLQEIESIAGSDLRALLLLIFSSSLKPSSYWLDWSVKPQHDRRPIRPSNPADINPAVKYKRIVASAIDVFTKRAKEVQKRYTAAAPLLHKQAAYRPEIVCADLTGHDLGTNLFDTIITSPPYLTSYEYADLHQLSVFWLFNAQTVESFKRSGFIGTKMPPATPLPEALITSLALSNLREVMPPVPLRHVDQYFTSMHNCLSRAHTALRPNGQLCIVIGDSRYKGHDIPNHLIFLDMLSAMGCTIQDVWERPIPNKRLTSLRDATTGRILPNTQKNSKTAMEIYPTEHILILKK
ncbi:MAG: hypothetical protein EOO61_06320 [Hymenobacter sp.]|nr:MAG: hypothetical protein EOO61_06320 [Hymenobacter sp.]